MNAEDKLVMKIIFALLVLLGMVLFSLQSEGQAAGVFQPYQNPKIQLADNNGAPAAGYKLCTYAAGTTAPLATYADAAGSVNSNPVILDSAGRATIYLGAFSYKFAFLAPGTDNTCATGATIWTQDNINSLVVSGGGSLILPSITGNTKFVSSDQMVDVRFYGAIGDGFSDDSTAIQSAITAGLAAGKCVFLPSGTWLINTGLTGNSTSTAACIRGVSAFGSGASILKYGGSATALTISNGGSYVYNAKLSNFAIIATQNAASGIICDTCSEFILDTVAVVGKSDLTGKFAAAFDLRGSHTPSSNIAHITNPLCQYNTSCFKLMDVSGIDIFGGDFYQNTQDFLMGSADHVHIHGIMNAEQQDYFLNWDDSLTPSGTILADNVNVEENNVVFDSSFGTHNYFLNVSSTGTNRFNLYNSLIQGNRIFCATGACATDYPFHFAVSGTTNANTLLSPVIKNNWLNGASTGGVTSNSAKVIGEFSGNQNYGVSGGLNVDVAGTVSSWLCMNNNRGDQVLTLGCNNRTAGIFASFYNAGDGATNLVIRESSSQASVSPFTVNSSTNVVMGGFDVNGKVFGVGGSFLDGPAGSVVASVSTTGNGTFNGGLNVGTGILNSGTGFKHARNSSVCTTGTSSYNTCTTAVTLPGSAFADTNYTATVSGVGNSDACVASIASKATNSVTVQVQTQRSTACTFTELDVIAVHD